MTPEEFVQGLADGGMPFAEDHPDYCPAHGWNCQHEWRCAPGGCYTTDTHFTGPREACCK